MPLNFSALVYQLCQDTFAVDCTFVMAAGIVSGRGIYDTDALTVQAEDHSIISDQYSYLYIRNVEFAALPKQLDHVIIPYDCNDAPLGEFEITDTSDNGGGETKLTLRRWEVKDGT